MPTSAICNPAIASTCARPGIAQCLFILVRDAAALAGDQRRRDRAGTARQTARMRCVMRQRRCCD